VGTVNFWSTVAAAEARWLGPPSSGDPDAHGRKPLRRAAWDRERSRSLRAVGTEFL